jgi:hypothetical protein
LRIKTGGNVDAAPFLTGPGGLEGQSGRQHLAAPRMDDPRRSSYFRIGKGSNVLLQEVDEAPLPLQGGQQRERRRVLAFGRDRARRRGWFSQRSRARGEFAIAEEAKSELDPGPEGKVAFFHDENPMEQESGQNAKREQSDAGEDQHPGSRCP